MRKHPPPPRSAAPQRERGPTASSSLADRSSPVNEADPPCRVLVGLEEIAMSYLVVRLVPLLAIVRAALSVLDRVRVSARIRLDLRGRIGREPGPAS